MRAIALLFLLAVAPMMMGTADAQRIDLITPRLGSLLGGTRVSILGTGFDIRGRSNDVFIGTADGGVFCDPIPNDCHASRIICITAPYKANGTLPLQVSSNGVVATCNYDTKGRGCTFEYSADRTPSVTGINPQYITKPSDITVNGLMFDRGDQSTGSFDFSAWFGDEERCDLGSNPVASSSFTCSADNGLFPGTNRLSLQLGSRGNADVPESYSLTVFPSINEVSATEGSTEGGQVVTITGNFFSRTALENEITIHGAPCVITQATPTEVVCVTSAHAATTTVAAPTYSAGVKFDFWGRSIASEGSIVTTRGKLAYLTPEISLTVANFGGALPVPKENYIAMRYTSWYVAPQTGLYILTAYIDDIGELWVGTDETPVEQVRTEISDDINYNERLIVSRSSYGTSSGNVTLVAGKRYWFQLMYMNIQGDVSATVTIKLPDGTTVSNPSSGMTIPSSTWESPVVIKSRGMKAVYGSACQAFGACDFNYKASVTPQLSTISPLEGAAGTTVTITGQTLAATASDVTVSLGGVVCPVTSATTASQIVFTVPANLPAAKYNVIVKVRGSGYARLSAQFTAKFAITSASNTNGILVIKGTGLNVEASRIVVTLNNFHNCLPVTIVSATEIQCAPPAALASGPVDVSVAVTDAITATAPLSVSFDQVNVRPGTTTEVKAPVLLTKSAALFTKNSISILVPAWTISDKSQVTVAFGSTNCAVFFAQGSSVQCYTASLYQAGLYEVIVSYGDDSISVGSLALAETVTSINKNYFSPEGGNVIDIYHSGTVVDAKNSNDDLKITYRGIPCKGTERRGFTTARCYLDDASLTAEPALPVLDSFAAATENVLQQLQVTGAVRAVPTSGFFIPAAATLFTRRRYNGSIRITAEVTPSVSTATCIRLNAMATEASATYDGITAIATGTRFTIGRDTWQPASVVSSTVSLAAGVKNIWRVEINSGSLTFYIDNVLVANLATGATHSGFVGFPVSCQDIFVNNLKIEDLTPATLVMTFQNRAIRMVDEPFVLPATSLVLKQVPATVQVGATARFSLSSFVAFQVLLFPVGTTNFQLTAATPSLCTDAAAQSSVDLDGTIWATCVVAAVPAGTYVGRFRESGNGFSARQITINVIPSMTLVTPTAPSNFGALLTITGSGFNGNTADFEVKVAGTACPITTVTETAIVCELPAATGDSSAALGPFAVTATYVPTAKVLGEGSITYKTSGNSPAIKSISVWEQIRSESDWFTFRGERLGSADGSFALIGGKVCSLGWGTAAYITCRFRTGSPAEGSHAIKYHARGIGYASATPLINITKGFFSATPNPTGLNSRASLTVPTQLLTVDAGFTQAAAFDFTTGSYENSNWALSEGLATPFTCAGSALSGFGGFNTYTVATRNEVTGLAAHQHLAISFELVLLGYDGLQIIVTVDGTPYTFTDVGQRPARSNNGLLAQCNGIDTFLVNRTFVVPHTASSATVSFNVPTYYSGRSWAIRNYAIKAGTLAYAVTVGNDACPVTFAENGFLRCTAPVASAAGNVALVVTENGTPLTCSTSGGCFVTFTAASNTTLTSLTFATIPGTTTGNDLLWGPTSRATVTSGTNARIAVSGTLGEWSASGASQQVYFKEDGFTGLTFTLTGTLMFGLATGGQSVATSYVDIDFAWYRNGNTFYMYEHGAYMGEVAGSDLSIATLRIESDDTVTYLLKDDVIYRSGRKVQWPLRVDTSLYQTGASATINSINFAAGFPKAATRVPVVIAGANFVADDSMTVTLDGTQYPILRKANNYVVVALDAALAVASATFSVVVTTASGVASGSLSLSPAVTAISASKGSVAGNHLVTVTGSGFTASSTVTIGGTACTVLSNSFNSIVCLTGAKAAEVNLTVSVSGAQCLSSVALTEQASVSFACPLYSYVDASTVTVTDATYSNGYVSVTGTNFNVVDTAAIVVGSYICTKTTVATATVSCPLPDTLAGGSYQVVLSFAKAGGAAARTVVIPITASVSANVIGNLGGARVTVTGANFGLAATLKDGSNNNVCASTEAQTGKSFVCITSAATFSSVTVSAGAASSNPINLAAAAGNVPTIDSVTPAVLLGFAPVTVTGSNFAGVTSLTIGGVESVIVSQSSTSIVVLAGAIPSGSVQVAIVVSTRGASAGVATTASIAVRGLATAKAAIGKTVTVSGSGFNNANAYLVTIGSYVCESPTFVSASSLTCVVTGPTEFVDSNLDVSLTQLAATATNATKTYSHVVVVAPSISSVVPSSGSRAGGVVLTITGTNFDDNPQNNYVTVGGARCMTATSSSTELTCVTSPTVGVSGDFVVTLSTKGIPTTSNGTFTGTLAVTDVSPSSAISVEGGLPITITGSGFPDSLAFATVTATVGGVACPVSSVSATQLVCSLGASPRPNQKKLASLSQSYTLRDDNTALIRVYVNGTTADIDDGTHKIEFKAASTPIINTVSTSTAASTIYQGTAITIQGSGFAATGNTVELLKQGLNAGKSTCTVTSQSNTTIVCTADLTTFGSHFVQVLVPNVGYAKTELSCPAGQYLTCDGTCFTESDCSVTEWGIFSDCATFLTIFAGDTYCHSNGGSDRVNSNFKVDSGKVLNLNCPLYSCEANDCNTTVTLGGHGEIVSTCGADPNGKVLVARPQITSINGPKASSIYGGIRLTIAGTNLNMNSLFIIGGGAYCVPLSISGNSVVCETTAVTGAATGLSLVGSNNGVAADCTGDACGGFSYVDSVPTVTGITPMLTTGRVDLVAGDAITISGAGFAQTPEDNVVTVGGVVATVTSANSTQIVFTAPTLANGDYTIAVRVLLIGLTAPITTPLARVRPSIRSLSNTGSSPLGGNTITITGSGLVGNSIATYSVASCGQATVVSASLTKLVIVTPACAGDRAFSANVDGYGSSCKAIGGCSIKYSIAQVAILRPLSEWNLSFTSTYSYDVANLAITVGNSVCEIYSTSPIVACSIPSYHAAGDYPADVILAGFGRMALDTAFSTKFLGSITSIMPTSGSLGGAQSVTIVGEGFATVASNIIIRVAGALCTPTSLTATQIVCLTSAVSAATSGIVNITNLAPVGYGIITGASYTYSDTDSPRLTSVTPFQGSTAGGTMLTIAGTRLSNNIAVTINGVACTQTAKQKSDTDAANGNFFYCTTGALSTSRNAVLKAVDSSVGAAINTLSYDYIDLWSRWTTWGNTPPPVFGDSAVVSEGQTIMLDFDSPRLHLILVMGHLMFDDSKNITLEATYIMINFGRFTVGTPEKPYIHNAVIRLFGDRLTPEIPVHGSKVLALRHGALDMHGIPRKPTFTKLAAHAEARSNTIKVRGPVDWKAGEDIVITSTDFKMEHAEPRTILSVSGANTAVVTITLTEPLYFRHNGEKECFDNNKVCIEEIAEVMLLTRNIKVVGDNRTQSLGFGATMFLMPMGQNGTMYARLSYVELSDVGQQYIVGRYPVHFHVTGTSSNSYCIGNAVHHTLNRAFSIHGVNNNTYVDNVVYSTQGHAFFIEDGNEKFNNISFNLVSLVHVSTSNLNTDLTPAAFWCVSPSNFITNNIAAGSAAYGFWISPFYPYSTGPGYSTSVCPATHKIIQFENNVAHSSKKYGLNIFRYLWPKEIECNYDSPDAPGVIQNFFSWKNKIHGVTMAHSEVGEIGSVTFDNLISANNGEDHEDASAFWVEHIGAKNMSFGIRKAFLIAQTSNAPHTSIHTRRGINLPLGDNFFAEDVTFINYKDENYGIEPQRWANRFSFCFPWGWEALFRRTRWVNNGADTTNKMRMRFVHHGILNDEDGTFGGVANTQIIPDSTLLDPTFCKPIAGSPVTPAVACTAAHKLRRFGVVHANEVFSDQLFKVDDREEIVPCISRKYSMSVPANKVVTIEFQSAYNPSTFDWTAADRFRQPNERNIFQTLFKEVRAAANATFDGVLGAMMDRRPTLQDTKNGYFFADKVASALVIAPTNAVQFLASTCPWDGCPIEALEPAALGGPCTPWEQASAWNSRTVPADGAAVRINFTESICITKSIKVYSLYLGGKLEFNNTYCKAGEKITLYVEKYIHVRGGILQAGSAANPLGCEFEIVIGQADFNDMGSSTIVPWSARALVVESGTVELIGARKTRIAYLSTTSAAGSKTLTLDRDVNWKAGDTIAISQTRREAPYTSSADRTEESEDIVIQAISGRTVTLTSALAYQHFGAAVQTLNGVKYDIGAEVVCLTRNIKMTGGHKRGDVLEYNFGWNFHVGCTSDILPGCGNGDARLIGFPMGPLKQGAIHIDSVQFDDIGQEGSIHAAFVLDGLVSSATELSARTSYLRNSAFNRVRAIGINIHSSTKAFDLTNNTLFNVDGDGIRVGGTGNTIDGNIILQNRFVRPLCHKMYDATIKPDCVGGAFRINSGNTVRNNIAASGDGAAFLTIGEACDSTFAWSNNFGLRHRDGLIISDIIAEGGTPEYHWTVPLFSCRVSGGMNAFSNSDQGIVTWYATGDVTIRDVVAVDNMFGVTALLYNDRYDRGEIELQYVLEDSTIAGHWTGGQDCDVANQFKCRSTKVDSLNWCQTIYNNQMGNRLRGAGVLEAVFVDNSYSGRSKGESKFYWIEPDSYATVKGRAQIRNVFFDNFDGINSCDQREVAFFQDFFSNDTFHQHTFEGITWGENVKSKGKYYAWDAYGNAKGTLTEDKQTVFLDFDDEKRGGFWPDAPYKQWLVDKDGSFSGTPGTLQTIFNSRTIARKATFDQLKYDGRAFINGAAPGAIKDGCSYVEEWNAYRCTEKRYVSLTLESYAEDSLTRRAGPLVMCKGDGMVGANGHPLCQGGEADYASGPNAKGMVQRATLDRLSRWRFTLEIGANYTLSFRGAPPVWIRMWLSGHEYTGMSLSQIGVVVNMRYFGLNARMRSIVYVDGVRKPLNQGYGNPYTIETPTTFPMPTDAVGTHYHNLGFYDQENGVDTKQYNIMSTTLRPNHFVDWKQESIITITATVSMNEEDFFDNKNTFAIALANVLGITANRLKFANIVAGTLSIRRELLAGSSTVIYEVGMSDADIAANADLHSSAATNDFEAVLAKINSIASDTYLGGVTVSSMSGEVIKAEIPAPAVAVSTEFDFMVLNATRDDGVAFNATYFKEAILAYTNSMIAPASGISRNIESEELAQGSVWNFYSDNVTRMTLFYALEDDMRGSNTLTRNLYEILSNEARARYALPANHRIVSISYVKQSHSESDSLAIGFIILIVIGSVVVVGLIAAAIIYVVYQRRKAALKVKTVPQFGDNTPNNEMKELGNTGGIYSFDQKNGFAKEVQA